MNPQSVSDETLMAYADGEFDTETASQIKAAAQADPEIARRIEMFRMTAALLGEAGRARPLEPLPSELNARVRETLHSGRSDVSPSETLVPFRRNHTTGATYGPMAVAACLALAVGLAGGFLLSGLGGNREQSSLRTASVDSPEIAQALETQPSGQRLSMSDGEIALIASFMNADGEFCREFEVEDLNSETVVSVACRMEAEWQPRFSLMASGSSDNDYAPASSLETLDAYLNAIGASAPLSLQDEAAALMQASE